MTCGKRGLHRGQAEGMRIAEGRSRLAGRSCSRSKTNTPGTRSKKGEYTIFIIEGTGGREPIEKASHNPKAMTFDEILKFSPNHDELGRFASSPGGESGLKTTSPKMSRKQINKLPDKVFSHEAQVVRYDRRGRE